MGSLSRIYLGVKVNRLYSSCKIVFFNFISDISVSLIPSLYLLYPMIDWVTRVSRSIWSKLGEVELVENSSTWKSNVLTSQVDRCFLDLTQLWNILLTIFCDYVTQRSTWCSFVSLFCLAFVELWPRALQEAPTLTYATLQSTIVTNFSNLNFIKQFRVSWTIWKRNTAVLYCRLM